MIPRISRLPAYTKLVSPIFVKAPHFALMAAKSTKLHPRFHIVCPRRISKKAVDRNAARRRIYAVLPKHMQSYDIRILLKKNISEVSFVDLVREVRTACKTIL